MLVALGMTALRRVHLAPTTTSRRRWTAPTEELRFASFSTSVVSAPAAALARIRAMPGVQDAEGRLVIDTGMDLADGEQATARVVGDPAGRDEPASTGSSSMTGRMPRAGADGRGARSTPSSPTRRGRGRATGSRCASTGEPRTVRVDGHRVQPRVPVRDPQQGRAALAPGSSRSLFADQEQVAALVRQAGRRQRHRRADEAGRRPGPRRSTRSRTILEPYERRRQRRARPTSRSNFMLQEEIDQNRVMASFMPMLVLAISSLVALHRDVPARAVAARRDRPHEGARLRGLAGPLALRRRSPS